MIFVDSSVWIDYFNGRPTPQALFVREKLGVERFATGDLILTEVLQGFRTDAAFDQARNFLLSLDVFELAGVPVALAAAQNYRRLRAKGVTVRKTIDVMIATFCITGGYTLLHADRDFDVMRDTLGLLTLDA
jgi:predicted nucleic acid-binding protein